MLLLINFLGFRTTLFEQQGEKTREHRTGVLRQRYEVTHAVQQY